MAQNYLELQGHLDRVRWAWKRAAALQGLATVVIEGLGMFLLFILLDYIYVLPQGARVGTLALMGAILAFFFVRHVIRPLLRPISDEQIAMYIEERQVDTEGALLTATSVGLATGGEKSPMHDFIVENIVQSAVAKAGQIQLSRVLNLAKLRKYAIAACVLLLFFGISALRYSTFFARYAGRLLMPWHMTEEDLKANGALIDDGPKISFVVSINPGGTRVMRGATVKVKAKLSMMPSSDVYLQFRSAGNVSFQPLKMDEVDELNTFALRLPDVNDDLEMFVQAGLQSAQRSDVVKLNVYDPLELKGYEVTLVPPAYTKMPAVTEFGPAGDITAMQGTKVKLRVVANTALTTGELVFDDGKKLKLTGETNGEKGAFTEFTVEKDASYTVRVSSADEQTSDPSSSFTIKATKDEPPSVAVETPGGDLSTHPGAEVDFRAKVSDDVGIASVELVYGTSGAGADDKTDRILLPLDGTGPGDHTAAVSLALPDVKPLPVPGSTLFYHFEVRDVKGQPAISDIYMLKVRPYEVAGAFPDPKGSHHHPHPPSLDLMVFIGASWNIQAQKDLIEKADYDKRCDDLTARMTLPDGSPQKFKKPKASLVPADKVPLIAKGDEMVKLGIATLRGHDAGKATEQFREAVALWTQCGVAFDMQDKQEINEIGEKTENQIDPMQEALGFLKMDAPKMDQESPKYDSVLPGYKRALKPEEAKELKDKAADLQKREQQLLEEAKKLAMLKVDPTEQKPGEAKPGEEKPGEAKPGEEKPGDPKEGDQKPGDQKPGEPKVANADNKPGENKPGENKPGDNKPGDNKPGEEKPGEQKPGGQVAEGHPETKPGAPGEARPTDPNAAQTADRNERAQDLQHKQEQLAGEARQLERQAAAHTANADKNTKEILDHFRATTRQMDAAVTQMKEGNLQQAAAHGEEARRELRSAVDKLQVSQFDNLDQAVAAADERAGQIAEAQKHIREGTKKVIDDAKARNAKTPNAPATDPKTGEAKLNPQDVQKLQGLAKLQMENQQNAENLDKYVGELEKWAEQMHKTETAENLRKAGRTMKLEDVAGAMRTTAVNLAQSEVTDATETQGKLDRTLEKVAANLQAANGSLAQTSEQKLKRAAAEAKEIIAKAELLANADGKEGKEGKNDPNAAQKPGDENKPGDRKDDGGKPGDKKDDTKTADANKPGDKNDKNDKNQPGDKKDDGAKNPDTKTADANKPGDKNDGKGDQNAADANKNDNKGDKVADNKQGKGDKNDKKALTPEQRRELQGELMRDTQRLVKRIEQDKLADGKLQPHLETIKSEKSWEEMFKEGKKTQLDKYLGSVHAVSSHLEDKLEMLLKAKRLSAAQREQTPIQYRDMVNKYYEQLAKE